MKPIRLAAIALTLALGGASAAMSASGTATIDTIAGGIPTGHPATSISITSTGVDVAPNGDVYFTDSGNGIIWRLTADGTLHHVAGSGRVCLPTGLECRYDGGDATRAFFSSLSGIEIAPDGDLYVAEMRGGELLAGYRVGIVRKIDAQTGIVSLFAGNGQAAWGDEMNGGSPAEAAIGMPQSLEQDSQGNLYIGDVYNKRIYRVTPDGSSITNVAGCGWYSWPTCVWAGDGSPVEGTTIAINSGGNGNGFGFAIDAKDDLYIADMAQILKLDDDTQTYRVVMGKHAQYADFPGEGEGGPAIDARMSVIVEMAFAPNGDLYMLEGGGSYENPWNRVQRIDAPVTPQSTLRHVGGLGTGKAFSGDGGKATLARFDFSQPSLWTGQGMAVAPTGEVYVSDVGNMRLRHIDGAGIVRTVAGNGYGGPWAEWAVGSFQPGASTYGLWARGGFSGDGGPATEAQLYGPKDVEVDRWGNVYLLDRSANRVRRIRPDGTIETVAGSGCAGMRCGTEAYNAPLGDGDLATKAFLRDAAGIALDRTGTQLYIADGSNQRVRQVNLGTTRFIAYPLSTEPVAIEPNRIRTVFGPGASTATCTILEPHCGEGLPAIQYHAGRIQGITTDAAGNLYVADSYSNQVVRADLGTGIVTHVTGLAHASECGVATRDDIPGRSARLCGPTDMAVSPDGRFLYVTESSEPGFIETLSAGYNYGGRVRRVDLTTSLYVTTILAGTGGYGFSGDGGPGPEAEVAFPHGVAVAPDGTVYIADTGNHRIRRVAANGTITTVAGNGDFLIGEGCELTGDGGPAKDAQLCAPNGLAFGPDGTLYVADELNNRIRAIRGL